MISPSVDDLLEIHSHALDRDDHFIQVPRVSWSGPPLAHVAQKSRPELENPLADCLLGDAQPSLGQEPFNISIAEWKLEIEPDRMLDDLGWKPIAHRTWVTSSTLLHISPIRQPFP
jgi:hypothetical protein